MVTAKVVTTKVVTTKVVAAKVTTANVTTVKVAAVNVLTDRNNAGGDKREESTHARNQSNPTEPMRLGGGRGRVNPFS